MSTIEISNPSSRSSVQVSPHHSLSVRLKYVKLGYHHLVSNALYLFLTPLSAAVLVHLSTFTSQDFLSLADHLHFSYATLLLSLFSVFFVVGVVLKLRPRSVYLVDFACYKAKLEQMVTKERFMELSALHECFTEESLAFQKKIMERSGYGQKTYGPMPLIRIPMKPNNVTEARAETEAVIFGAVEEVLAKTGTAARDVDILVVNSSTFNPTPSLAASIVNRFKLRTNILSYNLGGMGCSAGVISVDLARQLLQVHSNSCALVISTENITRNYYTGNDRSMLVTNCLFRVGGAAVLMSNKPSDSHRSKYQLRHTLRTHVGDDRSYNCILQQEDEVGKTGVTLTKELMLVAGQALKTNLTTLGPLVLPMSEQLLFFATLAMKKVLKMKVKPYIPDFKLAFEHFCVHAGGKGVLDEIEKSLHLTGWHMEPSRMTLYRFGNTSSSSLWYELAYSEAKGRVRKGDRVWQIGFGSGFKCNSVVWKAMKNIDPVKEKNNVWMDEIEEFPIHVPKVQPIQF